MTWWCENWQPNNDEIGCNQFNQPISGNAQMDADGEIEDNDWDRDYDEPITCVEHGSEATDLRGTNLTVARAAAYENAGWGYCEEHDEFEENPCEDPHNEEEDDDTVRTATFFGNNPIQMRNGNQVRWNVLTSQYDRVRPAPITIRTAWAPEGSAI